MTYSANTYLPGVIAIPSSLTITAITKAYPMVVTVSVNAITESNTYLIGQLVKLNIPYLYGMQQANGLLGRIIDTGASTLTLDINSIQFDAFSVPSGNVTIPAMVAPAGSRNLEYNNSNVNFSPFRSLNNIGN